MKKTMKKIMNKIMKKKKIIIIAAAVVCVLAVGVGAYALNSKSKRADKIVESAKNNAKKGNMEEAEAQKDKALELDPDNEAAKKMDLAIDKYYEISDLYDQGKFDEVEDKLNEFNATDYGVYFNKLDEIGSTVRYNKQKVEDLQKALDIFAGVVDGVSKVDTVSNAISKPSTSQQIEQVEELVDLLTQISEVSAAITPNDVNDIVNEVTNTDGTIDTDKLQDEVQNRFDDYQNKVDKVDQVNDKLDEIKDTADKVNDIKDKADKVNDIKDKADKVEDIKDKVNSDKIDENKTNSIKDKLDEILNKN